MEVNGTSGVVFPLLTLAAYGRITPAKRQLGLSGAY